MAAVTSISKTSSLTSSTTSTPTTKYATNTVPSFISEFNLGPAISVFTPPPSCLSTLTTDFDMFFGHYYSGFYDPSCYPSSTQSNSWDLYYYSPAQCPLEWFHATTFTSAFFGGTGTNALSLGPETTAVLCCPSGYTYLQGDTDYIFTSTGAGHICRSAFSTTTSVLTYVNYIVAGQSVIRGSPALATIIQGTGTTPYYVDGDGIPVWWQEKDLAAFSPASSTSHPSSTSSASSSASPSGSSPISNTSSSGLSSGAKIGLGVGIPVVVLALALIGFIFFHRYRKRRNDGQIVSETQTLKQELPNDGAIHEMYSDQGASELEGDHGRGRYELSSLRNS